MLRMKAVAFRSVVRLTALLAIAVPLLGSCSKSVRDNPNIVLVLVDQLRVDEVERSMPKVHALGESGVVFTKMRSAAPWTYPSVISMFSGLYPQQHGADGSPDKSKLLSKFSPEIPLLHELLSENYYTSAFVTNPFLQKWNSFHSGFDHYAIDEFIGDQGARLGHADLVWTDNMFSNTVNAAVKHHFNQLERRELEFTYVHYIDVHGPWDGAPFDTGGADHRLTEERAYGIAAGYIDERIHELYEYFMARYDEDLVFIVTSDHGQEMGTDLVNSQGYAPRIRKATVHDFNTRIPFILFPSKRVVTPRRIESPCSNIDIFSTLLDWAELEAPLPTLGVSLLPSIRDGATGSPTRAIYSIRSAFGHHNDCIVVADKKQMRYFPKEKGPNVRQVTFDLASDPNERKGTWAGAGTHADLLTETAGTHGVVFPKVFEAPDEELESKLQDIGYLGDE